MDLKSIPVRGAGSIPAPGTKLINRYMKVNVYINDTLYKTIDLGNITAYNPKAITDLVFADKEAGLIPANLKVDESMSIRIERV